MDEILNNSNNTSSLSQEVNFPGLTYETKGENRLIGVLYKKVTEIERELYDLKVKKILDETHLPAGLLEQNNLLPKRPKLIKNGTGYRPLLRSEIEDAMKQSPFCSRQAAYLGIHISTYKRHALKHNLWEPHPKAKGKRQPHDPNRGKYPLDKILLGEFNNHPMVTDWMVKKKLFKTKTFPISCSMCGYSKKRLGGYYPILLLDHINGERKDFHKDNLRYLCWNCTAECGRGYLTRGFRTFDPDWQPDTNNS